MLSILVAFLLLSPGSPIEEPTPSPSAKPAVTTTATPNLDDNEDEPDFSGIEVWETTTVSKKEEPSWTAPGVVSAVGITEIEAFGPASVGEIWELLPAVQNTFGTGINRTSIRGGEPNTSIVHVLVLVDGRPVRASGGNLSAYSPPYTFPSLQIDRIEVSRGPGSVMHGTNAFEGVLNIITRKGQENGFRAVAETGSFGTVKGEVAGSFSRGDFSLNAGILYHESDGWAFESAAVGGGTFSKDVLQDNKGYNLNVKYKGFKFSGYHGDMKQFALLALGPNDPLFFASQVTMMDFGYSKQFGSWNLEAHLTQNHEVFDWLFGETPVFPLHTNDWLGELTAYGIVGDVVITAGTVLQKLDTGTNGGVVSTPYEGQTTVYSLYAQGQYTPNDYLDLTLGFQYNQVEDVNATVAGAPAVVPNNLDPDIVPRLGLIWKFNPNSPGYKMGMKLLYGEAFRSPSLLEYVIDTPGIQRGNPTLSPETIETWDLQFFRHGPKYEVSLAAYNSVQTDLIIFRRNEEYVLGTAQNVARLESEGIEFECKYKPNSRYFVQLAFTWQDSEEKTGLTQASQLPSTNWKFGLGYKSKHFNLALFNRHDGAYKKSTDPTIPVINPASEAVDMVSLNCDIKLFSVDRGHRVDLGLNLRGTNLLDEEVWVPDFLAGAANTVPGAPGRAWYASLRVKL